MTVPESKHFCNVKISFESLLSALGSFSQLSNWHCMLLPVKTESQPTESCNQFCTLLQSRSSLYWQLQSSCSGSLCALFFIYLFCCQTAACEVFFFFPFMFLVCYFLWMVSVFFSQPLLQLPLNLHSCCLYVALCLFLCITCILSPFLILLIYYSHFSILPASCILFFFSSRNITLLACIHLWFLEAGEVDRWCCKEMSDLFFVGGD